MSSFYKDLPTIPSFEAIFDLEHYREVPVDWWVVITDVKGSTKAIQEGRYRAVNFVGAITIAAAQNAVRPLEIPFVFGGDGATLLIPDSHRQLISGVLLSVQETSRREYDLDLRVGLVSIVELNAQDCQVRVGKYGASPHYTQAVFIGNGLSRAEALIKDPTLGTTYQLADVEPVEADFTGVECRWQNVENPFGETVSLLVSATAARPQQASQVYREVLQQLQSIYGDEQLRHPVLPHYPQASFSFRHLAAMEPKVRTTSQRWLYVFQIWLQQLLLLFFVRFRIRTGDTAWETYLPILSETSDIKKFDEMLRMVLAGTPEHRHALESYLETQYQAGRLVYGLHAAKSALLTCVVYERVGAQVHFVDGADGGYALAAKGLKKRLKSYPRPSPSPAVADTTQKP